MDKPTSTIWEIAGVVLIITALGAFFLNAYITYQKVRTKNWN